MPILQKEYLCGSYDNFKKPDKVTGKSAIGLLLTRLLVMKKGTLPSRPDCGLDIKAWRYRIKSLEQLKAEAEWQIRTFLPCYQNATVNIEITKEKICNIEITIDDVVYVYDSANSDSPILLSEIEIN